MGSKPASLFRRGFKGGLIRLLPTNPSRAGKRDRHNCGRKSQSACSWYPCRTLLPGARNILPSLDGWLGRPETEAGRIFRSSSRGIYCSKPLTAIDGQQTKGLAGPMMARPGSIDPSHESALCGQAAAKTGCNNRRQTPATAST